MPTPSEPIRNSRTTDHRHIHPSFFSRTHGLMLSPHRPQREWSSRRRCFRRWITIVPAAYNHRSFPNPMVPIQALTLPRLPVIERTSTHRSPRTRDDHGVSPRGIWSLQGSFHRAQSACGLTSSRADTPDTTTRAQSALFHPQTRNSTMPSRRLDTKPGVRSESAGT